MSNAPFLKWDSFPFKTTTPDIPLGHREMTVVFYSVPKQIIDLKNSIFDQRHSTSHVFI